MAAAVTALEHAQRRGFTFIWLESDSTYVVAILSSFSLTVPWRLHARWRVLIPYLRNIHFRVSHVYREGNRVADYMANPAREVGFWNNVLPCIVSLVNADWSGMGICRTSF